MDNISSLQLRLAVMLADRRPHNSCTGELIGKTYHQEYSEGKTYAEIGRKYGITRQAVYNACCRYRKAMKKEGAENG